MICVSRNDCNNCNNLIFNIINKTTWFNYKTSIINCISSVTAYKYVNVQQTKYIFIYSGIYYNNIYINNTSEADINHKYELYDCQNTS